MGCEEEWRAGRSYAQWIRSAVGRARHGQKPVTTFFDSSVPEPVELLRETISRAFAEPITSRYTSAFAGGNPFVVRSLAARFGVPAEQILCTTGATGAITLLYRALARRGDHILVETPGFDLFHDIGQAWGLNVDSFQRNGPHFAIDLDEIAHKIQPNTRMIVLTNLHNPSGKLVAQSDLEALAELAERRQVLVVVDEVYGGFADEQARPCVAARLSPQFISISSLTKTLGLNTLRCGWIIATPEILAPVRLFSEQFEFGVSNLSHAVAALVLEEYERFFSYTLSVLEKSRPRVEAQFAKWRSEGLLDGALPEFGCISFPRLIGIDDTHAFSDWLLQHYGVIVAPGEFFGAPGHVRIGFGQPLDKLERGLAALDEGLHAYRNGDTAPNCRIRS